jgi:hypothetical protein
MKANGRNIKFNLVGKISLLAIFIGIIWIPLMYYLATRVLHWPILWNIAFFSIVQILALLAGIILIIGGVLSYWRRTEKTVTWLSSCYSYALLVLLMILFMRIIVEYLGNTEARNIFLGSILLSYIFHLNFEGYLFKKAGFKPKPFRNKELKICSIIYSIMIWSVFVIIFPQLGMEHIHESMQNNPMDILALDQLFIIPIIWLLLYFTISRKQKDILSLKGMNIPSEDL